MREKKKNVERENVEFRQWGYRISCAQFCCPGVRGVPEVKRKKKIDKLIVAMPLKKQGNKIKISNCDNDIAENGGERGSEIYGRVKKKKCHVHNIFTTFS